MITVGHQKGTYATMRNIVGAVDSVRYRRVWSRNDWERVVLHGIIALGMRQLEDRLRKGGWEFREPSVPKCDVIHLFNTISFGRTPWITTFETVVPRYPAVLMAKGGAHPSFTGLGERQYVRHALRTLAGDRCRKLIAMSECSRRLQESFLGEFPEERDRIVRKIDVLYPPQRPLINGVVEKRFDVGKIRLMFVGTAFFRKGGGEIVNVMKRNRAFQDRCHLVLVSRLMDDNYVGNVSREGMEQVRALIATNPAWIEYYASLPNSEVLELMKRAHVGLLPTHADSFGYSVLEFQAAGCPVISTDVRALPEINSNAIGWVINVPKNRYGEACYETECQRNILREQIEVGLERILSELCENPDMIYNKSVRAYDHVSRVCSPELYADRLRNIYLASL